MKELVQKLSCFIYQILLHTQNGMQISRLLLNHKNQQGFSSYLFRYTLCVVFVIPVLCAYFVQLLDTQYLHITTAKCNIHYLPMPAACTHPSSVCPHMCTCEDREGGREGERQGEEHTGHRSLTISSYEILNFLNMTYTTTEICKSSSSTRNVKYKHPSHIIIDKKASWKETKVRLPLCNLVG